jgi:hypothetical protein
MILQQRGPEIGITGIEIRRQFRYFAELYDGLSQITLLFGGKAGFGMFNGFWRHSLKKQAKQE